MARDNEFGIDLEHVISELNTEIEDSVNFIFSEFGDEWERAERYYAGGTDMPAEPGRSQVVKTEVRDSIRALKPSIMRTLLHARKPVEYLPTTVFGADLADQQALYVNQLFWANDGYNVLLSATSESMKKKIGPVKTYWEPDPIPKYIKATKVTAQDIEAVRNAPDCDIIELSDSPLEGEMLPGLGGVELYDIEFYKYYENGRIRMEAFPATEYFVSRNATGHEDGSIHGHRRDVTVGEALTLGLEYDEWEKLSPDDPEQNEHVGESTARRGYAVNSADDLESSDLANHKFLLTECYCSYDLDGTGQLQKYVFWFGGTNYEYLSHEKIEDFAIDVVQIDPVAFTSIGRSIADLTMAEQDFNTSILRAVGDNFHMANNPRPYANPMLVDFNDLMNNAIGAPIKVKAGGDIGTYNIPFTGQQGLPFLQYLEMDVQTKVGVTKASQGLDPDAMQSTDKEAVRNTIMMAQGQTEFIVRNILETALISMFKKLLKLSVRHMDRNQVVRSQGMIIPVDLALIDPDLVAIPNVGLGAASPEQKLQGLMFFLGKQEQYMEKFGFDNPFVSLEQVYNTYEDIAEITGFTNVGRYFKIITPDIEQQLAKRQEEAQKQQQEQQANAQFMDPSKAAISIESGRARIKQLEILADREKVAKDAQARAIEWQGDDDYKRDKLAQDRVIDLIKVKEGAKKTRADLQIRREQASARQQPNEPTTESSVSTTK